MRITLFGSRRPLDQFAGVPEQLSNSGHEVRYERLWDREMRFGHHAQPGVIEDAHALAFADLSYNAHLAPARFARERGIPTVLLVDGVVEHANTYSNPWLGPTHLQNTPHDLVLAMGRWQGELLERLGNRVIVTGLPRLDGFESRVAEARRHTEPGQWLLVSTALTPALDEAARGRVLEMLAQIRTSARLRNLPVRWRTDSTLASQLGVQRDESPLAESLAGARATLSTASTLVVESMIAGVPTAVAHPHCWPLWVPAAWTWRAREDDGTLHKLPIHSSPSLDNTLDALLEERDLSTQESVLELLHTPDAADRVANAITNTRLSNNQNPIPSMGSVRVLPTRCSTLYIAVCDHQDPRPRMVDTALTAMRADPDSHLLCIGTSPLNFEQTNTPSLDHPHAHAIVLDPLDSTHERANAELDAALALKPSRIEFDDDRALALAARLVNRGVVSDDRRLARRNDFAVRQVDLWPWGVRWPANESSADAWLEHELRLAGYESIELDEPSDDCDAVLVRAATERPSWSEVKRWRDMGLGVAISPNMVVDVGVYAAERAVARLMHSGCRRIAVAHTPGRSPVLAPVIRHGAPIIGWLDDDATEPTTHMGLPAYPFTSGLIRLRVDGLLTLHERDLERYHGTGLPTELVDLRKAAAHEIDHVARKAVHREAIAHPRIDRG
mgnify:CR=1 FL=1